MRPAREIYARKARTLDSGLTIEVGVEYRRNEGFTALLASLGHLLDGLKQLTPESITAELERRVKATYPDRAYFIEAWQFDGDDGWIQVYQPWPKTST